MKLLSLEIKGFGPYSVAQKIDFPSARKVVILGENGAGKTFLLDAIPAALFKTVPNRKGGFYEQFSGNNAYIDLRFEMGGRVIQAKRIINAVSRQQKAFLYVDGEVVCDGKADAFAEEIKKLGINETAFLAAVYQTQNGVGNALNMDVDARIKLLSTILDLIKFDGDYEKVVEAHRVTSRAIEDLKLRRGELERRMPDLTVLDDEEFDLKNKLQSLDGQLRTITEGLQTQADIVAKARANAQGVDDLKRESANLEKDITADNGELNDLNTRLTNNRTLLEQQDSVRAAVVTVKENRLAIAALQEKIAADQEFIDGWEKANRLEIAQAGEALNAEKPLLASLEQAVRDWQGDINKQASEIESKQRQIQALTPSTQIIERVPCKGMDINETCELLQNAHANVIAIAALKDEIVLIEREKTQAEQSLVEAQHSCEEKRKLVADLDSAYQAVLAKVVPEEWKTSIGLSRTKIQELNEAIQQAEPLANKEGKLEGLQERVDDYEIRIPALVAKIEANTAALLAKQEAIKAASDITATLAQAEAAKNGLEAQRQQLESTKQTLANQLAQVNAAIVSAAQLNELISDIEKEIGVHGEALAEIQLLREGLGPKGAKNVKIDAAGKAITERANRLIRIGLGPQFSIVIKTLRELQTKDENGNPEQRETLEIKIINNDNAEEMLIENLSGGEKAMAGLVFSLSLAVEQREASSLDIRTLILDEPSAGLSEENSVKYLDMLDAVLNETGLQQVFFISHMPVMQNLADASIFVWKGREGESSIVEVKG